MRLIDADALKEMICNNVYPITDTFNSQDYGMFWTGGIEKAIDEAETVDTERHGNWIVIGKRTDCEHILIFKCSCCHTPFIGEVDRYHYCPNCGTKIDEIEEGEVVVTKKGIIINMDEVEE